MYSVVHVDFAENFTFVTQNEIQSAYWNQKQATVYTVVIQTDADHRNMVLISNRMTHDTAFVYCTQEIIVVLIREEYRNVHKIHYVSDGLSRGRLWKKAAWTFTSSGHGKSGCDGLGAAVKSGGRKHSLKGGSAAAFTTAKDFYAFTLKKYSRAPHEPKVTHSNESSDASSITTNDELTDDEMDTISTNSKSSIEVRWLHADEVEETFEQHLKNQWNKLSEKSDISILS
ncbi:unnamed protein product [Adineta ricciae]|uniref:Uncharacterized protein n=1 Tax=Adineta ricciae TaxID=249248 RepID=A0A815TB50_ADIRI|nr:unnamed protein product [Adineta ricciae]